MLATQGSTLCCPIDVGGGSDGTSLYLYGNSNVKSIKTTRFSNFCLTQPPSPWRDGVKVELYASINAQDYFGAVFYGHVKNWIANGTYNTNTKKIGELAADCQCACASGIHVHMTRSGGASNIFSCYQTLYAGSTWIYSWNAF